MNQSFDTICNAVLSLSREQRIELLERVLLTLDDKEQARIEAGWLKELESRTKAVEQGEIELIPAEEVFRQYRSCRSQIFTGI